MRRPGATIPAASPLPTFMYRYVLFFALIGLITPFTRAQDGITVEDAAPSAAVPETPAQRDARLAWWRDAKFGLFIHWGVYAVPAGKYGERTNYGEWIFENAKIPVPVYRDFAKGFNPVRFDAQEWARVARDAGMRYVVITAKHHEGFSLYPSDVSTWDVADATPYGKDLLGPLTEAVRAQGLKMGFYYSQAQDWMHPGGAKRGRKDGEGWDEAHKGSFDAYLRDIAVPQVRELLTRYQPDILWWDTPYLMTPGRAAPFARLLTSRPGIITNNRLGGGFGGDTRTPEGFVPVTGYSGDWETCMTIGRHWGYNAEDTTLKSGPDLLRKLVDICSKGGNFLLNVSPDATGKIPAGQVERLADIGRWLATNGEAIYGTRAGPFAPLSWGSATRKGDRLYLHVTSWPADGKLRVPLLSRATSAHLLAAPGQKLALRAEAERLVIDVPAAAPDPVVSVVVLDLAEPAVTTPIPSLAATVTASAEQPNQRAALANDGSGARAWRAPADVKSAWIEFALPAPAVVSGFGADEPDIWPRMKQSYVLAAEVDGAWRELASGKTHGHGAVGRFPAVKAQRFRLTMECEKGAPAVAELQLYRPE